MSIIFDMYGKVIPRTIKYKPKLSDLDKDIIKEISAKPKYKPKETRTFFCNKHQCFHKFKYKGKPSQIYKKCVKDNIVYFKDDLTTSELFTMSFRKQWNQDKANYYK